MAPPPPGFDSSHVSPQDAVVTLRSFRRRFAEAFDQADTPEGLADRPAGGGLSPAEHAAWTASALEAIGSALHDVLLTDDPRVVLPSVEPPGPVSGATEGAAAVLARLGDAARRAADAMADVHGDDWSRAGQASTGSVTALDIARLGVRIGVEHLRAAEQAIRGGHE